MQQKLSKPCGKSWPTPATRDWKDTLSTVPPSIGKTRGHSLGQALADEIQKNNKSNSIEDTRPANKNRPTPTAREWEIESLEVYIRRSVKRMQKEAKSWPTPPASQRGEDLEVYIRKSINRVKKGGVKFAATLQVAVEAEDKQIEIDNFKKHNINIEDDTEIIVKSIMKDFYKKDSQKKTQETK